MEKDAKDRIMEHLIDSIDKLKSEVEVLRWINEKDSKGGADELGRE